MRTSVSQIVTSLVLATMPMGLGAASAADDVGHGKETLRLAGLRVVIVIADGYHEHEFWFPYYRFREEGLR